MTADSGRHSGRPDAQKDGPHTGPALAPGDVRGKLPTTKRARWVKHSIRLDSAVRTLELLSAATGRKERKMDWVPSTTPCVPRRDHADSEIWTAGIATSCPSDLRSFSSELESGDPIHRVASLRNSLHPIQLAAGASRLNGVVPDMAFPTTAAQMPRPVPCAYNGANAVASSSKAQTSIAAAGDVPRPEKAKMIGVQPCTVR
ncbi:hypothetical protein BD310DRAFT_971296 [Dichomitus squalens]|uniref:Uncharacterized protein n=1 Tax=Dichomitus squalens TaxID=114155 RepID=A0A4Q9PG41_9APHY|nr:hypothetical protein BD310DRAFT_971296 [Dichomitus squalens]